MVSPSRPTAIQQVPPKQSSMLLEVLVSSLPFLIFIAVFVDSVRTDMVERLERFRHGVGHGRFRRLEADRLHRLAKALAVFRQVDGVGRRAEDGHAGSFEGQTTFGVGVRTRLPFRVFALSGATGTKLVIDVAHRWP